MSDLADMIVCLQMLEKGKTPREIYDEYYSSRNPKSKYKSFRERLLRWQKRESTQSADTTTLTYGTYPNFLAHGATVQVDKSGKVVQAWIKQHTSDFNMEELLSVIKENTTPMLVQVGQDDRPIQKRMLEIPLYDMHFPLSAYEDTLSDLLLLITAYKYEEINLIIGQDLFHNDDFRGRTTSGRPIEKFNMISAWKMAEEFWYNVISYSLLYANKVNLIYSKGNHDETLAWAFVQRLECMFPEVHVDDSLKSRKCIHWNKCFIGISHGCMKKNSDVKGLRGQFTIDFPQEFADSTTREIHVGHLHHEEAKDLYGVNVRRLSTAVPEDEWSDNEGYVGAHKRFMIFEWKPEKLHAIYFV